MVVLLDGARTNIVDGLVVENFIPFRFGEIVKIVFQRHFRGGRESGLGRVEFVIREEVESGLGAPLLEVVLYAALELKYLLLGLLQLLAVVVILNFGVLFWLVG